METKDSKNIQISVEELQKLREQAAKMDAIDKKKAKWNADWRAKEARKQLVLAWAERQANFKEPSQAEIAARVREMKVKRKN